MQIEVKKQFLKDVENLPKDTRAAIKDIVLAIEQAGSILDIGGIKKLTGHKEYYRIRIGQYRIGFAITNETVILARCLHRREIYRFFP